MAHLITNGLILGLIIGFGVLHTLNPDLYYQHVQEDQPLEWATFWAFMLAAVYYARAAVCERRAARLPWFVTGLAAFCVVVAMEEISWGQRLLGYQPPRYFLENNFQQELNLHNVMATSLRKQILGAILVGYGLVLPLLSRIPTTGRLLAKIGVTAPPAALALVFATLVALLVSYPLQYTGELIEAAMALSFVFAAISTLDIVTAEQAAEPTAWRVRIGAVSLIVLFAFGSALWSRGQLAADPVVAEVTATEIRAIERDLRGLAKEGKLACGKHERLNLMAKLSSSDRLANGRFNGLIAQGLPEERADFFIDPWSTAYWVRTTCNDKRDKIFLYSFGPNRRRDSGRWERRGDDIGVIFRIRKDQPPPDAVAQRR